MFCLDESFLSPEARKAFFAKLRKGMAAYPRGKHRASSFFDKTEKGLKFLGWESGEKVVGEGSVKGIRPESIDRVLASLKKVRKTKEAAPPPPRVPKPEDPKKILLRNQGLLRSLVKNLRLEGKEVRNDEKVAIGFSWKDPNKRKDLLGKLQRKGWKLHSTERGSHVLQHYLGKHGRRVEVTEPFRKGSGAKLLLRVLGRPPKPSEETPKVHAAKGTRQRISSYSKYVHELNKPFAKMAKWDESKGKS